MNPAALLRISGTRGKNPPQITKDEFGSVSVFALNGLELVLHFESTGIHRPERLGVCRCRVQILAEIYANGPL
ncbi:hypothetical protein REMIM1_PF00282 (plasmid) [Rhizobium etli bv. mimosae str. Mim1]|nr:hypothetical protein REMIM1_PF00282 [Rhizobium etli bv. mimosae str. Mim1]